VLVILGGCSSTVRTTDPRRTATEQSLHTTAGQRASAGLRLGALDGRRVYLERAHLNAADDPDQRALLGAFRADLLEAGARLVDRSRAEIIVELRSAGLGVDRGGTFVGVPAAVIEPYINRATGAQTGSERLPADITIYRNAHQTGLGSVSYVAYFADTGELVTGAGPSLGRSNLTRRQLMFIPLAGSDIPTIKE